MMRINPQTITTRPSSLLQRVLYPYWLIFLKHLLSHPFHPLSILFSLASRRHSSLSVLDQLYRSLDSNNSSTTKTKHVSFVHQAHALLQFDVCYSLVIIGYGPQFSSDYYQSRLINSNWIRPRIVSQAEKKCPISESRIFVETHLFQPIITLCEITPW